MSTRTQYRPDLRTTLPICTNIQTNATLTRNMPDEFDGNLRQRRVAEAKAHAAGVSTTGKRFVGQLCPKGEFFSPRAWVSESDYMGGCKALAIQQGKPLNDDGFKATVKAPVNDKPEPGELPYSVNKAIVKRAVKDEIRERVKRGEPKPTPKERVELSEKLCEYHSGH